MDEDIVYFQLQIPKDLPLEEKRRIKEELQSKYSSFTDEYFEQIAKHRHQTREAENKDCTNLDTTFSSNPTDRLSDDELFFYKEGNVTYCFDYSEIDSLLSFGKNPYTMQPLRSEFVSSLLEKANSPYAKVDIEPINIAYQRILGGKPMEAYQKTVKDLLKERTEELENFYLAKFPNLARYTQFATFFNDYTAEDYTYFGTMYNIEITDQDRDKAALQLVSDLKNFVTVSTQGEGEFSELVTQLPLAIDDFMEMKRENMTLKQYEQYVNATYHRDCYFTPKSQHYNFDDLIKCIQENDVALLARILVSSSSPYAIVSEAVDPTANDNYAIRIACENDNTEIVKLLLDWSGYDGKRVDPTANDNEAIRVACMNGHTETVKLLLDWVGYDGKRVDPTAENNYAIRMASRSGRTETVKLLLDWPGYDGKRVDPTVENNYAIRMASRSGRTETVKFLLDWVGYNGKRIDPTDDDNYAIRLASQYGHTETVKLLLDWVGYDGKRIDPTDDDNYAIRLASENGHTETVKLLLDWRGYDGKRVDPTVNDNYAIRIACEYDNTEIVKLLLAWPGYDGKRVDPTVENNYAIRIACKNGRTEIVKLLLAWPGYNGKRVDPTANDNEAIRFVSRYGYSEIVKLLLAWPGYNGKRVDPTVENNYAIRMASQNGHIEIVRMLLAWRGPGGEFVDPTNNDNQAIKLASQYGHTEIVELLKKNVNRI